MNIGNELFFAPGFSFAKLRDFSDKPEVLKAFTARVRGFYLTPAHHLAECKDAFACGLVCSATIDFLGRYRYPKLANKPGKRIARWLKENIPEFDAPDPKNHKSNLARRFCSEFRNGLVHEGRVKSLGQFSFKRYERDRIIHLLHDNGSTAMVVHPGLLHISIDKAFGEYCVTLGRDSAELDQLIERLKEDFKEERKAAGYC